MINLSKEIRESRDSRLLNSVLRMLVGLPCLKMERSYGGELTIHFGGAVDYGNRLLAEDRRGEWVLGTRGSAWTVALTNPPCCIEADNSDHISEIERTSAQLVGATVVEVQTSPSPVPGQTTSGESLLVRLSNGAQISINPTADPENSGLADWELFTPMGMYLACGPGSTWSFLSSSTPAKS